MQEVGRPEPARVTLSQSNQKEIGQPVYKPFSRICWKIHYITSSGYHYFLCGERAGYRYHVKALRAAGLKAWATRLPGSQAARCSEPEARPS